MGILRSNTEVALSDNRARVIINMGQFHSEISILSFVKFCILLSEWTFRGVSSDILNLKLNPSIYFSLFIFLTVCLFFKFLYWVAFVGS